MFVIAGEGLDQLGKTEFLSTMTKHLSSLKTKFDEVAYVKFPFKDTWYKYQTFVEGHAEKKDKTSLIEDMINRRRVFDDDFKKFREEGADMLYIVDRTNISNLVYFFIEYLQIVDAYKQSRRPHELFNIPNNAEIASFLMTEEEMFPDIDILIYSPYSEATETFLQNYGVTRQSYHTGIADDFLVKYGDLYYKQIIDRQIESKRIKNLITPKSFVGLKDYTQTVETIMSLI